MGRFELSLGATHLGEGRTRFRVWAPDRSSVEVALEAPGGLQYSPLERAADGYFQGSARAGPGTRYRYRLDGGDCFPDPCSRFQPEGPHGPSLVVDPAPFQWTDAGWKGLTREGNVLYELHVGTFAPSGTYEGVQAELGNLKDLGVTAIQLMPLHGFPGRYNWGYDGVNLFAPCAVYGTPDQLRSLVDTCHRSGLGVILDVVYNHLGPDGNYLGQFSKGYFTDRYPAEWGEPINFDGPDASPVRDFFIQNACYWVSEFHLDGLRLDATQAINDASPRHVLADLAAAVREAAAPRRVLLIAETESQDVTLIEPQERGGKGLDMAWIDDFHHSARVAATGFAEAYLSDYRGNARELVDCARHNSLFQGQWYAWQKGPRGSPLLDVEPEQAVFYLQNHDQVANTLTGQRLHALAGPAVARALTTYFLLLPQTPMLFMGQEFFASSPFLYFADHSGELAEQVRRGRERFLSQFPSIRAAIETENAHPAWGEQAFRLSRLDFSERLSHAPALALHRELLKIRHTDPVFSGERRQRLDGAAPDDRLLLLRAFGEPEVGDRLIVMNLGPARQVSNLAGALWAPPRGQRWRELFSSEDSRFGGGGASDPSGDANWALPGVVTLVFRSEPKHE